MNTQPADEAHQRPSVQLQARAAGHPNGNGLSEAPGGGNEARLLRLLSEAGPADAREILPIAVPKLLEVLQKGAGKYDGRWRELSPDEHREHAVEHFRCDERGEDIEDEGGRHIWNGIMRMIMVACLTEPVREAAVSVTNGQLREPDSVDQVSPRCT